MSENILGTVMSTDWRAWLWKTLGEQFNVPALSDCVLLVAGKSREACFFKSFVKCASLSLL